MKRSLFDGYVRKAKDGQLHSIVAREGEDTSKLERIRELDETLTIISITPIPTTPASFVVTTDGCFKVTGKATDTIDGPQIFKALFNNYYIGIGPGDSEEDIWELILSERHPEDRPRDPPRPLATPIWIKCNENSRELSYVGHYFAQRSAESWSENQSESRSADQSRDQSLQDALADLNVSCCLVSERCTYINQIIDGITIGRDAPTTVVTHYPKHSITTPVDGPSIHEFTDKYVLCKDGNVYTIMVTGERVFCRLVASKCYVHRYFKRAE
jgi:hypothetical protein